MNTNTYLSLVTFGGKKRKHQTRTDPARALMFVQMEYISKDYKYVNAKKKYCPVLNPPACLQMPATRKCPLLF